MHTGQAMLVGTLGLCAVFVSITTLASGWPWRKRLGALLLVWLLPFAGPIYVMAKLDRYWSRRLDAQDAQRRDARAAFLRGAALAHVDGIPALGGFDTGAHVVAWNGAVYCDRGGPLPGECGPIVA